MPTKKKRINMTLDPRLKACMDYVAENLPLFEGWPISKVAEYYINEGLKAAEEEAKAKASK